MQLRWSVLCVLAAGVVQVPAPPPSEAALRAEIEQRIRASGAEVAVAFRTLDGGDELLIQPDVSFHAASTMKVPVMIELYRQAHAGPLRLDEEGARAHEFPSLR